jgi:hypothetical protein
MPLSVPAERPSLKRQGHPTTSVAASSNTTVTHPTMLVTPDLLRKG